MTAERTAATEIVVETWIKNHNDEDFVSSLIKLNYKEEAVIEHLSFLKIVYKMK